MKLLVEEKKREKTRKKGGIYSSKIKKIKRQRRCEHQFWKIIIVLLWTKRSLILGLKVTLDYRIYLLFLIYWGLSFGIFFAKFEEFFKDWLKRLEDLKLLVEEKKREMTIVKVTIYSLFSQRISRQRRCEHWFWKMIIILYRTNRSSIWGLKNYSELRIYSLLLFHIQRAFIWYTFCRVWSIL